MVHVVKKVAKIKAKLLIHIVMMCIVHLNTVFNAYQVYSVCNVYLSSEGDSGKRHTTYV